MLSCKEYLDLFPDKPPEEIHIHGLDLLNHTLQGDTDQTWYKHKKGEKHLLYELQTELEAHNDPDDLDQVLLDNLTKKDKWIRFDSDEGDLDVERFLENTENDVLIFDSYHKTKKPNPAITLILDCAISAMERGLGDMAIRHKKIYTLAVQAFQEGRPCRIIALWSVKYLEESTNRKLFITIKDFNDPIFSGIWGAFKTNKSTNSFLNVIMDYFIGTHDKGNGTPKAVCVTNYIPREEYTLIDPKRLHY